LALGQTRLAAGTRRLQDRQRADGLEVGDGKGGLEVTGGVEHALVDDA
jgi:hypothetical protein